MTVDGGYVREGVVFVLLRCNNSAIFYLAIVARSAPNLVLLLPDFVKGLWSPPPPGLFDALLKIPPIKVDAPHPLPDLPHSAPPQDRLSVHEDLKHAVLRLVLESLIVGQHDLFDQHVGVTLLQDAGTGEEVTTEPDAPGVADSGYDALLLEG